MTAVAAVLTFVLWPPALICWCLDRAGKITWGRECYWAACTVCNASWAVANALAGVWPLAGIGTGLAIISAWCCHQDRRKRKRPEEICTKWLRQSPARSQNRAGDTQETVTEKEKHMHHATASILGYFDNAHLPPHLAAVSGDCMGLAHGMVAQLPEGPELMAGLRKLLEAKDCFVRAALEGNPSPAMPPPVPAPAETNSDAGVPVPDPATA
jgi:hypothetical protein